MIQILEFGVLNYEVWNFKFMVLVWDLDFVGWGLEF